jgi:site-specific DNA-methyltransferase (adenine-specific)
MEKIIMIELFNVDCMLRMVEYPDKYFDLAIVDPPYGIKEPLFRKGALNKSAKLTDYNMGIYNQPIPDVDYFIHLWRISKNQIIWGGNYFGLPASRCWIVWDKETRDAQWADAELAWTSFNTSVKIFKFAWNGMIQGDMKYKEKRIHPTQKPVHLYKWLLHNYAKKGDKILDTHLGSGSSAIACYDGGFDFVGYEIDDGYFKAAKKRIETHQLQQKLF